MTDERRVLITGATGFVGGYLIDQLHTAHPDWVLTGTTLGAEPRAADTTRAARVARIVPCDLRDAAATNALLGDVRPEVIFHLAGQSSVPVSFANPEATLTNNILGMLHLLEGCRVHAQDARLLIVSSAEVYGIAPPEAQPLGEDRPYAPVSPYAVSKATNEMLALQYARSYGMDVIIARPFNHIGPGQAAKFVVSTFAKGIAEIERGQRDLLKVGNLAVARDFSDVRDIVWAYDLLVQRGVRGGVYNIGRGEALTVQSVLDLLCSLATVAVRVERDPAIFRPADAPLMVADITRLRADTGWEPRVPFAQTTADILNFWRRTLDTAPEDKNA